MNWRYEAWNMDHRGQRATWADIHAGRMWPGYSIGSLTTPTPDQCAARAVRDTGLDSSLWFFGYGPLAVLTVAALLGYMLAFAAEAR